MGQHTTEQPSESKLFSMIKAKVREIVINSEIEEIELDEDSGFNTDEVQFLEGFSFR